MMPEALRALAAFLPQLRSRDAVADSFAEAAYEHGWILKSFDWPAWAQTAEARALRDDEHKLGSATAEQLARLITVCVRQDRFIEGALQEAVDSGMVLRIVRRAMILVGDLPASER